MKNFKKNFKIFIFVVSVLYLSPNLFSMEIENKNLKKSPNNTLSPVSPRGATPVNAHLSSKFKAFLTTPDEAKINEITKESTYRLLSQELEKFFYKEFVFETIIQENFPIYNNMCEKLATAAIYADATYHKPSINLRLAFRKNRTLAREMILEVRNQTEKKSWLNIAATLELIKLDALSCESLGDAKFDFITQNPAQANRLIGLCDQNINLKAKIEAYKLFIKCYLPYCNSNPEITSRVVLAISYLIQHFNQSTESGYYLGLMKLINSINNKTNDTYITQYKKQESETLKCLREAGFELSYAKPIIIDSQSPQKISHIKMKTEENITN